VRRVSSEELSAWVRIVEREVMVGGMMSEVAGVEGGWSCARREEKGRSSFEAGGEVPFTCGVAMICAVDSLYGFVDYVRRSY
jgi:hypothetical protein